MLDEHTMAVDDDEAAPDALARPALVVAKPAPVASDDR